MVSLAPAPGQQLAGGCWMAVRALAVPSMMDGPMGASVVAVEFAGKYVAVALAVAVVPYAVAGVMIEISAYWLAEIAFEQEFVPAKLAERSAVPSGVEVSAPVAEHGRPVATRGLPSVVVARREMDGGTAVEAWTVPHVDQHRAAAAVGDGIEAAVLSRVVYHGSAAVVEPWHQDEAVAAGFESTGPSCPETAARKVAADGLRSQQKRT